MMQEKIDELHKKVSILTSEHSLHKQELESFRISVQSSLAHIDKSIERMVDMFDKVTRMDYAIKAQESESNHKDQLISGKIKGIQELTKKDIGMLKHDFEDITKSIKTLTWTVVSAVVSVFVAGILKAMGVL